jgi:hypothetical protein
VFLLLLLNVVLFVLDHVLHVPGIQGLYLNHAKPQWYQVCLYLCVFLLCVCLCVTDSDPSCEQQHSWQCGRILAEGQLTFCCCCFVHAAPVSCVQWVTHAFCHANWQHLSMNLFNLCVFGKVCRAGQAACAA